MISATVMRGLRAAKGSWNTGCILRRSVRSLALEAPQMTSWPSKETVPEEGGISPRTIRATVLLPEPDSPTSPRVSPRAMEKETRSTTHFCSRAPRHPERRHSFW